MSNSSPFIARLVRISGRVQGVGYRAWAEREAKARRLRGWVRNMRDGTVEALFIGDPASITGMIEACRSGPRFAKVDNVQEKTVPIQYIEVFCQSETA